MQATIGAVLSQTQDNEEQVITYASKSLKHEECNRCITQQE